MAVRLNKYLASCGICSRRDADALIASGRVQVNGRPAETGMTVEPGGEAADVITVDGRAAVPEKPVLIALYKPVGVVSGTDHHDRAVTVTDLTDAGCRLFPVGRLDKDSEGLMLLTNMGDLSERIAKAGDRHEKEYEVTLEKPATASFLRQMAEGVTILLENGGSSYPYRTKPARVSKRGDREITVILTEGKNRQIRKMCTALGNRVVNLKRVRIMTVRLGDLAPGKWRRLTDTEIEELEKKLWVN